MRKLISAAHTTPLCRLLAILDLFVKIRELVRTIFGSPVEPYVTCRYDWLETWKSFIYPHHIYMICL